MHPRLAPALRSTPSTRRGSGFPLTGAAILLAALLAGCAPKDEAPAAPSGHMFGHTGTGVALELPSLWAGRYRVTDSITAPAGGLERELALRMVKADSTIVDAPLIIIRVFANSGWSAVPLDSASAMWGTVIAHDTARTVAVRLAGGNPLAAGTPDALAFDSLMISVIQRPMRANLRAPTR